MTATLQVVPLFRELAACERILLAGAGGGFDLLAGLPLYFALRALGKAVHLANLTFSAMAASDAAPLGAALHRVRATTQGDGRYFPEKHLAVWLRDRGEDDAVYCFEKAGVAVLREAYKTLAAQLDVDAVVLVDGGTDILMHGDEVGLGTPEEDVTSLLAAHALDVPTKLVTCVGFGIDAHHGVCHAHFLENVAALTKAGAFYGTFSLLPGAPEVDAWLDALTYVQNATRGRESIVCASLADAVRGEFGDHHSVPRTRASGSELFINPLMGIVWTFGLDALAERSRFRSALAHTRSIFEVSAVIEAAREGVPLRPRRPIPA
jgi:hypothetical protein